MAIAGKTPGQAPIDLGMALQLPPEKALEYFRAKGFAVTLNWRELWQQAHAKAFTVAGVVKIDLLKDIRYALDDALQRGETLAEFQKNLTPVLQAKGWWGKIASITDPATGKVDPQMVDVASGEMKAKALNARRLETIYQTNLQTSYMAGRYQAMRANVDDRPYWQYVAVMDRRTRPSHAALNGLVFRCDDPFWSHFYPPNGFNCRCRVRALDRENLDSRKLALSDSAGKLDEIEVPASSRRPGDLVKVGRYELPDGKHVITDPGWNYNPGANPWIPDANKFARKRK